MDPSLAAWLRGENPESTGPTLTNFNDFRGIEKLT